MNKLFWAAPEGLEVHPDSLRFRVDIYRESILLHRFDGQETTTKLVSAVDIARAFASEMNFTSGVLPPNALWWGLGPEGEEVALWVKPRVWKLALALEAFQPPRRFALPMPGLVFLCSPGRPPRVYAAKRRPGSLGHFLDHAPLFNLFADGRSCPGSHKYPERVEETPESFFTSFFTRAGDTDKRSKKHPHDLLALWEELDGEKSYPMRDLVVMGTVEQVMGAK